MSLRTGASGAVLFLAAATAATAVSAATVTYDLTGGSGETASAAFAQGSLGLTVTALSFDEAGAVREGSDSLVTLNAGGLGVRNSVSSANPEKNRFVDGRSMADINDLLLFAFDRAVTSVTLGFVERPGFDASAFTLFLPTDVALAPAFDGQSFDVDGGETLAFASNAFGIGALRATDQFLVSSITVQTEVAPIPLPAAGGLLLAGLGTLALRRRRR